VSNIVLTTDIFACMLNL